MTVAYVMLNGNGGTQRWGIAPGMEAEVHSQIVQVGTNTAGNLTVVDPGSDTEATHVVAWAMVAAAVVLGDSPRALSGDSTRQYA